MSTQTDITTLCTPLDQAIVDQAKLPGRLVMILLAERHILVEGLPGLAKTTVVKALTDAVHVDFQRAP